jgi:hypothetical protein
MVRMIAVVGAVASGILAGYFMHRLPIARYWQSLGALMAGWVLASTVLAAVWLLSPPVGIDVLAVSIGLKEAALSFVVMIAIGSLLHWLLVGPGAAFLPAMEVYRTPVMGFAGALVGLVSFSGAGGVHPVG